MPNLRTIATVSAVPSVIAIMLVMTPGCRDAGEEEVEQPAVAPVEGEIGEDDADELGETGDSMIDGEDDARPADDDLSVEDEARDEMTAAVEHANQLWEQIANYADWPQPEGFEGWEDGISPHGAVLRYYINDEAQKSLTADGAVIVKANYAEESEDALLSVTVMQKRMGYAPDTQNWFYAKYTPEGSVMPAEGWKMLAGVVGRNDPSGCSGCHADAGGGDYLFMNDR